jgi:hypothetical protein
MSYGGLRRLPGRIFREDRSRSGNPCMSFSGNGSGAARSTRRTKSARSPAGTAVVRSSGRVYIRRCKSFVFFSRMRKCNHRLEPHVGNSVIAPAAVRIRVILPRLAAILPSATSWEFWDGAAGDPECKAYEEFALVLRVRTDMNRGALRASGLWHRTRERFPAEASLQCRDYPMRLTVKRVSETCTNLRR